MCRSVNVRVWIWAGLVSGLFGFPFLVLVNEICEVRDPPGISKNEFVFQKLFSGWSLTETNRGEIYLQYLSIFVNCLGILLDFVLKTLTKKKTVKQQLWMLKPCFNFNTIFPAHLNSFGLFIIYNLGSYWLHMQKLKSLCTVVR